MPIITICTTDEPGRDLPTIQLVRHICEKIRESNVGLQKIFSREFEQWVETEMKRHYTIPSTAQLIQDASRYNEAVRQLEDANQEVKNLEEEIRRRDLVESTAVEALRKLKSVLEVIDQVQMPRRDE